MVLRTAGKLVLALFALLIIVPLLIVAGTSLKTTPQFMMDPLGLPASISFSNFTRMFTGQPMWGYFRNSASVTLFTVAAELLLSGMIAYGIIRSGRFTGRFMFGLFAVGLMVPSQVNMIPIYKLIQSLGWTNSLTGLTIVSVAVLMPLSVFMLTGFMRTLPREMLEAGAIDGAGEWTLLLRIVFPLSAPYLSAAAAFLFVIVWNDLLFPLLLLTSKDKLTLPLALLQFRGEYVTDYPMLMAGVIAVSLPMILMFVFLQRFFISGALAGSLKG